MFCSSRQILFGGRTGKMSLLIVKVADPCSRLSVGGHPPTHPVMIQIRICNNYYVFIFLNFSSASAASSLKDLEVFGNTLNSESDLQLIMHSEKFQYCLLVMERSILGNIFQPNLALYRQLPALEGNTHLHTFSHFRITDAK